MGGKWAYLVTHLRIDIFMVSLPSSDLNMTVTGLDSSLHLFGRNGLENLNIDGPRTAPINCKCTICAKLPIRPLSRFHPLQLCSTDLVRTDMGLFDIVSPNENKTDYQLSPSKALEIATKAQKHEQAVCEKLVQSGLLYKVDQNFTGMTNCARVVAVSRLQQSVGRKFTLYLCSRESFRTFSPLLL